MKTDIRKLGERALIVEFLCTENCEQLYLDFKKLLSKQDPIKQHQRNMINSIKAIRKQLRGLYQFNEIQFAVFILWFITETKVVDPMDLG